LKVFDQTAASAQFPQQSRVVLGLRNNFCVFFCFALLTDKMCKDKCAKLLSFD